MVDFLFIASKFYRYGGPNNHLLDLSNFLYTKSGKQLVLLTHSGIEKNAFSREIRFLTLRNLHRMPHVISNIEAIRHATLKFSPRKIFVNSDVNLAFQTYFATHARLLAGYNIFQFDAKFSLNRNFVKMLYHNLLTCQYRLGPKILVKKILAHTNLQKKFYIKVGIKPDKIAVIPHCVSLERLHRALKNAGKREDNVVPTVMYVGRLVKNKGIMELLKVYEQITRETEAHLLIVGSGPLEGRVSEMKRRIERENAKASISHVTRSVPPELIHLMNNADIVVVPSHFEMFGLVALEAMALKKAVLATCFGGTIEIVTSKVDGVLVNPLNSRQFKSRLEELISDRSERTRLGNAAYQTVKNKYDVAVVAPKFARFLDSSS
jgi:glycosyltransferase involved in cell wall biosynthesis